MKAIEFIKVFETYFPKDLAYDWDNIGMQIGTSNKEISTVLLSLDLTLEVVEEAIKKDAELIVVHHPLIFSPLKKINTNTTQGKIIEKCIKNDIAVYVAHTNFDNSNVGMNVFFANMLGLQAHEIIDYTTETEGLGRIGLLPTKVYIKDYIETIKTTFQIDSLQLIGDEEKLIRKVAICGGSGSSLIHKAKMMGADLFITGDITYHHALDARAIGLNILDVGHNIEKLSMDYLNEFLSDKVEVKLITSTIDTNPYQTK